MENRREWLDDTYRFQVVVTRNTKDILDPNLVQSRVEILGDLDRLLERGSVSIGLRHCVDEYSIITRQRIVQGIVLDVLDDWLQVI